MTHEELLRELTVERFGRPVREHKNPRAEQPAVRLRLVADDGEEVEE